MSAPEINKTEALANGNYPETRVKKRQKKRYNKRRKLTRETRDGRKQKCEKIKRKGGERGNEKQIPMRNNNQEGNGHLSPPSRVSGKTTHTRKENETTSHKNNRRPSKQQVSAQLRRKYFSITARRLPTMLRGQPCVHHQHTQ